VFKYCYSYPKALPYAGGRWAVDAISLHGQFQKLKLNYIRLCESLLDLMEKNYRNRFKSLRRIKCPCWWRRHRRGARASSVFSSDTDSTKTKIIQDNLKIA
jgi:hypothetical protein